jgi:hypothetical protein
MGQPKYHEIFVTQVHEAAGKLDRTSAPRSLIQLQAHAPYAAATPPKHKAEVIKELDKAIAAAVELQTKQPSDQQRAALKLIRTMRNDVIAIKDESPSQESVGDRKARREESGIIGHTAAGPVLAS